MARTIGEVDFIVDFDGRALPTKARRIGEQAGATASKGFRTRFDDGMTTLGRELAEEMDDAGELAGITFTDSMMARVRQRKAALSDELADVFFAEGGLKSYFDRSEDVDGATVVLREKMRLLRQEGGLTDQMWERLHRSLNRYLPTARAVALENDRVRVSTARLKEDLYESARAYSETNVQLDSTLEKMKAHNAETKKGGFHWRSLSHNLRQAILIVVAVAAGMEQIAVLGSGAGAGLTIFGAAAAGALIAAIPLVIGFTNLDDNLKKLSASAQAAVGEFKAIGKEFGLLQIAVQNTLLGGGMAGALERITTTLLPALQAGLVGIAGELNTGLIILINRLTSPEGISKLGLLFEGVKEQVRPLLTIIGNLGSIITSILIIAQPYVMRFLGFLQLVTGQFDAWLSSTEGRNSVAEWFNNGMRVLDKFGDLLAATGKLFSGLVDEESVQRTERFLTNLAESMTGFQDLLEILGELDLFGAVAAIFNDIGTALSPLLDLLKPFASIIGDSLLLAIQALGVALQILLAPLTLLQPLFNGIAYFVERWTARTSELLTALQPLLDEITKLGEEMAVELQPAIEDLIDSFFELLPSPEEFAKIIRNEVIPAVRDIAAWVKDTLVPALIDLFEWAKQVIDGLGGFEGIKARIQPFVTFFSGAMLALRVALTPVRIAVNLLLEALIALGAIKVKPKVDLSTVVPGYGRYAAGILANRPTVGVFAEEGPEAVVPLNRPLSQVNPDVRALSAFAQGKLDLSGLGGGKTVNFAAGAIVVSGVRDEKSAAKKVLDEIVDNI